MINRTVGLASIALIVLISAVTVWRIAVLPDWTRILLPDGAGVYHFRPSFTLFALPAFAVLIGGVLATCGRMIKSPHDVVAHWRPWASVSLACTMLTCAAMQAFILARSLRLDVGVDPQTFIRGGFVVTSLLAAVTANQMPKLPWLQSRFARDDLDPARGAKLLRFAGLVFTLMCVADAICAAILSLRAFPVLVLSQAVAAFLALCWRRYQLRKEQGTSDQPG